MHNKFAAKSVSRRAIDRRERGAIVFARKKLPLRLNAPQLFWIFYVHAKAAVLSVEFGPHATYMMPVLQDASNLNERSQGLQGQASTGCQLHSKWKRLEESAKGFRIIGQIVN